jgi:hypothetical protein
MIETKVIEITNNFKINSEDLKSGKALITKKKINAKEVYCVKVIIAEYPSSTHNKVTKFQIIKENIGI